MKKVIFIQERVDIRLLDHNITTDTPQLSKAFKNDIYLQVAL